MPYTLSYFGTHIHRQTDSVRSTKSGVLYLNIALREDNLNNTSSKPKFGNTAPADALALNEVRPSADTVLAAKLRHDGNEARHAVSLAVNDAKFAFCDHTTLIKKNG